MLSSRDYKIKADEYAKEMKKCFEESQNAYKIGEKAKAKELSIKGNEYKSLLMETNSKYNDILKLEKDQVKNYNPKINVISDVVSEKNKKDKLYLVNYGNEIGNLDKMYNNDKDNESEYYGNIKKIKFDDKIENEHNFHRSEASSYGKKMGEAFNDAKLYWEKGDKAKAKELSNFGYECKKNMEVHNASAVKLIATKNNNEKDFDEIDLHGLYVNEAIEYFKETLILKMGDGNFESLKVIVGKGLHSKEKPKIKEAIINFVILHNLQVYENPLNPGCLIVCV